MGKVEQYNELIFELGDMARERMAGKANAPRSLDRVLKAEEVVLARRQELEALEQEMNDEDANQAEAQATAEEEKKACLDVVKRYRQAVVAIEGRVKELRKKLAQRRAEVRFGQKAIKVGEKKHAEYEMRNPDPRSLEDSRNNLKKMRLQHMRAERTVEELEAEFNSVFDVPDEQPGAEGIRAQKRLLDIEDELVARKDAFDSRMEELDQTIAVKEEELKAAEDYLDQAVFLLGEECYSRRIADPALAAYYPRLDNAT